MLLLGQPDFDLNNLEFLPKIIKILTLFVGHLYLAIRPTFGEMTGSIACQIVLVSSFYAFGSLSNRILVCFFFVY